MSRFSIAQLEAFYWTAELGSVQKAAEKLNIAQPTLSLRLRQLESDLSSPVLERAGRGIRLTREGHTFLRHTQLVLAAHRELQASSLVAEVSGALRFGVAEGFAVACLPRIIPGLREAFPLLRPEWTVGTSTGLEQNLIDGRLDIAILVDPIGQRDIRLSSLGIQGNVWAAAAGSGLRGGETASELARLTIITTPPPTPMYRLTMSWFADGQEQPGPLCICSSLNASLQLVSAGIGIGAFPARMVEAFPSGGSIMTFQSDPPLQPGRVYVADRADSDHARTAAVIRVLETVTREMDYFSAP
ncbi:LysR family transcriptional regulator [Bosea sp. 685]|uniref:LysR family transcriptional regulator n=1 Tax=Bosea sp. 685 TaxID=3080057 RepID=UPI002892CBC1|nr:LysR family transcriptional regulator [Bosea sp. 685]WNJ93138.1 LysR family transcriptional regulator [Bosea sp. 685]